MLINTTLTPAHHWWCTTHAWPADLEAAVACPHVCCCCSLLLSLLAAAAVYLRPLTCSVQCTLPKVLNQATGACECVTGSQADGTGCKVRDCKIVPDISGCLLAYVPAFARNLLAHLFAMHTQDRVPPCPPPPLEASSLAPNCWVHPRMCCCNCCCCAVLHLCVQCTDSKVFNGAKDACVSCLGNKVPNSDATACVCPPGTSTPASGDTCPPSVSFN